MNNILAAASAVHQLPVPWWWVYYTSLGRFVAFITVIMALLALARLRPARRGAPQP